MSEVEPGKGIKTPGVEARVISPDATPDIPAGASRAKRGDVSRATEEVRLVTACPSATVPG